MVFISSPFTGPSSTLRDAATLVQGLQKGLGADRVASATRPFSLTMSVNYANTAERIASGVARQVEVFGALPPCDESR